MPRTSPSDDTISVTTRPQPPCRFTSRRNAVSVMPAIGATTNGEARLTLPIFTSVGSHIGGIDFDADRLANQVYRQHETCMGALANEAADDPLQRSVRNLDHHPLADHRAGIVGELALDELADAVDFLFGNRR